LFVIVIYHLKKMNWLDTKRALFYTPIMMENKNISSLLSEIKKGRYQTIILAIPDMQGRLVGKRLTARHFSQSVAQHGTHACAYLLTVDMEMDPVAGYELTSWSTGYQDFTLMPDATSWRSLAWLPGTAMVLCDVVDHDHQPIAVSPRQVLRQQILRAKQKGYTLKMASELEFYLFRETYESAAKKNWTGLEHHGPT
jgi:glutamine synthetase